jgi:hypothetical protein
LTLCSLCPLWLKDMEKIKENFFELLNLPDFPVGKPVRRVLIAGARPESLTIYLAAFAAVQGFDVLIADGANAFDPYVVSRFARKEYLPPDELLKKIWIARAFTCHQLATLVRERLASRVSAEKASLVVLLGPCTLFLDEDVPGAEAALLFRKTLVSVQKMSQRGVFFLMSQSFSGVNTKRSFLLRELAGAAEAVLKLRPEADTLQVVLDKPRMTLRRRWEVLEEFKKVVDCGTRNAEEDAQKLQMQGAG